MPTITFTVEGPGAGTGTLWFKPRTNFTTPDGDIVTPTDSRRDVPYTLNAQKSVVLPEGPWQVSGLATKTPLPFDVTSSGGDLKDLIVFGMPTQAPVTTLAQAVSSWMDANVNTEVTDPVMADLVADPESAVNAVLSASYAPMWKASTAYASGALVMLPAPINGPGTRNTAGNSRGSFDATEQAAWTATGGGSTMVDSRVAELGVPRSVDIGSNLAAARPTFDGPVLWLTSAETGLPANAIGGDLVWRYAAEPAGAIAVDTFTRANGALLGSLTEVGGFAWAHYGNTATASVVDGKATYTAQSGTTLEAFDAGVSNCRFRATLSAKGTDDTGYLAFRMVDNANRLTLARQSSSAHVWRLNKRIADTQTAVFTSSRPIADGDTFDIELNGSAVTILLNGTPFWSGTISDAAVLTGTKYGFGSSGSAVGGALWDDFYVTEL
ncbi:minor tail protein [Gordonia phage CheeseTouch]